MAPPNGVELPVAGVREPRSHLSAGRFDLRERRADHPGPDVAAQRAGKRNREAEVLAARRQARLVPEERYEIIGTPAKMASCVELSPWCVRYTDAAPRACH